MANRNFPYVQLDFRVACALPTKIQVNFGVLVGSEHTNLKFTGAFGSGPLTEFLLFSVI